ncbi:MAG: tetratricopeptide repeat protein [Rivularia sp. (in: cyanobacteria)]
MKDFIVWGPFGNKWGITLEYDRAIKKNPNDAAAFYNRGTIRASRGNSEKAIADFTQVIRINPTDASAFPSTVGAYLQRGRLYHRLGDKQKALADYHKAAEICKQQKDNFCYERTLDDIKRLQQSSPSTP